MGHASFSIAAVHEHVKKCVGVYVQRWSLAPRYPFTSPRIFAVGRSPRFSSTATETGALEFSEETLMDCLSRFNDRR